MRQPLRRMLRIAIVAAALLLVQPERARAGIEVGITALVATLLPSIGPISLAAGAGFGIATGTWALASSIVAVAGIAGSFALNALFAPSLPSFGGAGGAQVVDPGGARDTFEASEAPELNAVGRVRIGGLKAFGNTDGVDRYRMTLHLKGEVDGVEAFYFGGREIIADYDTTGAVSSYPWNRPGDAWAFLKFKNGADDIAAWPDLIDAFPELVTADHRARGITQTLGRFVNPGFADTKFLQLYQGGVPDVELELRAAKDVYDPRIDDTQWTENGILNVLHILLSFPEFTAADIDMDQIAAEADLADAAVATKGGTAARARCCGIWSSETARGDTLAKGLDSIGAYIAPAAGGEKIGIRLYDDDPAAEFLIAAEHIVDVQWQSGPEAVERPNICRVKYYSPERNYELAEIDLTGIAWARIEDEVTAFGPKYFDIDLSMCPHAGQAQRIARRRFELARAPSGVIQAQMPGLAVWGCAIGDFELPDGLGTIRCLIGAPRVLDRAGLVEIPFVVWPDLPAWDPDVHEAAAPEQIPELAYGSPLTIPDAPSAATVVQYPDASYETRVRYTVPGDAAVVEATYRDYTGSLPGAWVNMTEYAAGGVTLAYVAGDKQGDNSDFRLRTFNGENGSNWSELLNVPALAIDNTAPGAPDVVVDNVVLSTGSSGNFTLRITSTAPSELNVANLAFGGTSAPAASAVRPKATHVWNVSASYGFGPANDFTINARASDNTAGPTRTVKTRGALGTFSDETRAYILAINVSGGNAVQVHWRAPSDGTLSHINLTGSGAPGLIAVTPNQTGSFTATPSAGNQTYTAQGYANGGVNPLGTAASVTLPVG